MTKKILMVCAIFLIAAQFWPDNKPPTILYNANDIFTANSIPEEIESSIKNTCYNCHSNETSYPWYAYISPASLLISKDVREAREHLNFSEWESLSKLDKAEALDDLVEEIRDKKMPGNAYTIMHPKAKLSEKERNKIIAWAEAFAEAIFE